MISSSFRVVKIELGVPWDCARRGLEGASEVKKRTIDLEVYRPAPSHPTVCSIIDNRGKGEYGVILSEILPEMDRLRPVSSK